ncbi:6115_t:CDS:2 [Funneliformis geosporum]|uniref:Kynurenine 3-monooxygenase n=1 Tax=Funneliformis geosporum TaxID=1117311 RepID=A0A9W4SS26_9GLOM|nr:6115_t:CDS:2 [Funneliformis geosporum]CAI2178835.1 10057_t:CDS:2 [Funneliformis geosporum]
MSTSLQETVPKRRVAIIGGGLVGALTVLYFAKRGWQVSLFELREDLRVPENKKNLSHRSINLALSARGLSALKNITLGLDEKILEHVIHMKGRMIHLGEGKLKSHPYGVFGECIYSVEREILLELLLNTAAKSTNVKMYFQHQLKRCNFDDGTLELENKKTGNPFQDSADLIIGADGAFSVVRTQLMRVVRMDYSQEYISHAYLELTIPPRVNDKGEKEFAMDPNHLHIWPRHSFMMIALPNRNKSFTCTLFMPFENFDAIRTEDDLMEFFRKYYVDSIPLIGEDQLKKEYFRNPRGSLMSIKCKPYHYKDRAVIIGDAAHCMVPFFGQGMNCGFQDVEILNGIFDEYEISSVQSNDKLALALEEFTKIRHPDAITICDLAMYNYIEMRSNVVKPWFLLRKRIEETLYWLFPTGSIVPLYTMVSFSTIRYSEAVQRWKRQGFLLNVIGMSLLTAGTAASIYIGYYRFRRV